jgi:chaperone modulatory protein CbpM
MTDRFSEDEVVATVTRLTRSQLVRFVEADFVKPAPDPDGYVYRRVDIARLELLCDLTVDLDLDDMALGIVISLIDQLHAARRDLADMTAAIDALPPDLKAQVLAALKRS